MKSRIGKNKHAFAGLRKLRGRLPADVDVVQAVHDSPGESGRLRPPAKNVRLPADAAGKKKRGIFKAQIAPPFSDHLFRDAMSLCLHAIAARKILRDPSILEQAQITLQLWLSKQRPAPKPFIEWKRILAGTPQEIAAVALSMTEEATRLRSSSPLGFLLTHSERAEVFAIFGKTL
jgi:hypothetical protein